MSLLKYTNMFFSALAALMAEKLPVGGQAVIEGVLMKGPGCWALAVRNPDQTIWTESWPESNWTKKSFWKFPVIRGFATMVEMMRVGMRALSISADRSLGEEEIISTLEMIMSVVFAIFAVVAVFLALPMFISEYLTKYFGISVFGKNVIEGVLRGVIFVGYVFVIGLWKDMRRVFEYHGAEHKTINAYEADAEMVPEEIAKYSRIHKRCGTSFLLVVVIISIMVFSLIPFNTALMKILSRVVLLPLIIGLSYEFIKYASKDDNWATECMKPMLLLQYITTKNPDCSQIEIALTALNTALERGMKQEN